MNYSLVREFQDGDLHIRAVARLDDDDNITEVIITFMGGKDRFIQRYAERIKKEWTGKTGAEWNASSSTHY